MSTGAQQLGRCVSDWLIPRYTLNLYTTAVKAVTAAQLSMASQSVYSVTLDEAIEAMRLTAADMSVKYKETSLSVRIQLPRICQYSYLHRHFAGFGGKPFGLRYRTLSNSHCSERSKFPSPSQLAKILQYL